MLNNNIADDIAKLKDPISMPHLENIHVNINKISSDINAGNDSIKIHSQIFTHSVLLANIAKLLSENSDINELTVISDEDKMNETANSTLYMPIILYNSISDKNMDIRLVKNTKNYASILRVSDYIAGTMSDIDINTGAVSKRKFFSVYESLINNNPNVILFKI